MDSFVTLTQEYHHIPVLAQEVIVGLSIQAGGHYLDATVGGGGHSALILAAAPDVHLTAIDQDPQAIATAQRCLAGYGDRLQLWQGNFATYDPGSQKFTGILADLGVSSAQFDQPQRGFSFRHEAPLDMRMNGSQALTAAEVVNHWSERDLADIFYHYGEERFARRIAYRIVAQRPFTTTTDLARAIACWVPRRGHIHPATRVFQALRIAVNQELTALEQFLCQAPHWLEPSGRLAIISFHSLEDRLVKTAFRQCPQLQIVTKKPIIPQAAEIQQNSRSRSAKLRLAQRQDPYPDSIDSRTP